MINAEAVCELLRKLAARYAGLPLTLVLDNARYQKCEVVRSLAAELGIELLYLPSYSPNLNLIERLWKFVKKECLSCRYYEDFARFKAAIVECLEGVEGKHKSCDRVPADAQLPDLRGTSAPGRVKYNRWSSFRGPL